MTHLLISLWMMLLGPSFNSQILSTNLFKQAPAVTPISLISHGALSSTNGANAAVTINTVGANLIVLVCGAFNNSCFSNSIITSSPSACTLTLRTAISGSLWTEQLAYCYAPTTSSSQTFTYNPGGNLPCLAVMAFGNTVGSTIDQISSGDGSGSASASTLQAGTLTPSANNTVVISTFGGSVPTSGTPTISPGAVLDFTYDTGNSISCITSYTVQTTAAAYNPTWSPGATGALAATNASFK